MNKYLGTTISILSLIGAIISVLALTDTIEMAQNLSLFAEEFNKSDWQQHWRISSLILLISSCGGIISGVGILKNKQWAFLLFACLLSLIIITQTLFMLFSQDLYEFEKMYPLELLAFILICIFAWVIYFRRRKVT